MKILRPSADVLTVKTDDSPLAILWLLIFALCAAWGGYLFFTRRSPFNEENFQGALGGAVTGLIGFLALYERGRFTFDRDKKVLTWYRQRALRRRSGTVPFREIRSVFYHSPIGDEGVPSRRVVLVTDSGELPLTLAFVPDTDDRIKSLAESLKRFVGGDGPVPDMTDENVRAAVKAGRITEAVRVLRQEKGMSLEEAKDVVDGK